MNAGYLYFLNLSEKIFKTSNFVSDSWPTIKHGRICCLERKKLVGRF